MVAWLVPHLLEGQGWERRQLAAWLALMEVCPVAELLVLVAVAAVCRLLLGVADNSAKPFQKELQQRVWEVSDQD